MSGTVVVAGGGVVGLSCAYHLARRGHRVTVLDRAAREQWGCSWGNLGMIVPSHFEPLAAPGVVGMGLRWALKPESPFGIRFPVSAAFLGWAYRFWRSSTAARVERASPALAALHLAGRACYEELESELESPFGLRKEGLLVLCRTRKGLDTEAEVAHRGRALGLRVEILDAAGLALREPDIRIEAAGAAHYLDDCHLTPDAFMRALLKGCLALGVEIESSTGVEGFERDGRSVAAARTARGPVEADSFVVACGAATAPLARDLGFHAPIVGGKGYSISIPGAPHLPRACAILAEDRVAVTPMGGALRIGGTMEIGATDLAVSPARVAGIQKAVTRMFPEYGESDFEGRQVWSGLRPVTPDGLPMIGRVPGAANAFVAAGHAMMGMSLGPISGKIVAGLVDGEPPEIPIELLAPERFS